MSRWSDLAEWRGTSHHGGALQAHRGLVVHIAEGYYEGTVSWQQGDNSVSSHFVVDRDGHTGQMVDTDLQAWTQRAGNREWLSVECAGFSTHSPYHANHPGWEKLTAAQIDSIAKILVRAHHQYGVPLQLATSPDGHGLGHHCMGGAAWGHLDCPGDPIIAQKAAILARAHALNGDVPPATLPELKQGATGGPVKLLQAACNNVPGTGADVSVDGNFGPATEAKLKRVQNHFKITADGVCGPVTWGKLGKK
jgi:peptidoglycan hydrolase-like protein with peptidoglycan-binding domain